MKHINTYGLALFHLDIATRHKIISIVREAHALNGADKVRERTATDPVLGVVQAHQRIGAARGEVAAVGGELGGQHRSGVALEGVLAGGVGAIDGGAVVRVVDDGVEVRIGENSHSARAGGDVDALAGVAKEDLIGLDGLLVRGDGSGAGGGKDENVVGLFEADQSFGTRFGMFVRETYLVANN